MRFRYRMFPLLMSIIFGMASHALASEAANEALKMISKLAKGGYGFVERVRNDTGYPCDIYFVKDKPEDFLPELTTFRIKSLAEGKYFSYRQQADGSFTFKVDATDPSDPNTLFVIRKGISPDLTPRIAISPYGDSKVFLTYDKNSRLLKFTSTDFVPEENKQCQWQIVSPYADTPNKMDKVCLQNRFLEGCLTVYRGQETIKIEPDTIKEEKLNIAWGLPRIDNNIAFGDDVQIKSNRNGYRQYYLINTGPGENTFGTEDKNDDNTVWQFVPWKTEPPKDSAYVSFGDAVALGHVKTKRIWNVTTDRHGWDSENRSKWELKDTYDTLNSHNWDNTKDWLQDFAILDYNESDSGKRIVHDADLITTRFYNPFNRGHTCYPVFYASNVNELRSEVSSSWGGDGGKYQVIQKQPGALFTHYTINPDRTIGKITFIQKRRDQTFIQISGSNNNDVWAVSKDGGLYHFDGQAWNEEKLGAKQKCVSVAADRTVCCVGTDKILRTRTPKGWIEITSNYKWLKVSVRNKDEVWGIADDDKQVYKLTNQMTRTAVILPGEAQDICAAENGSIWATNTLGQVFRLEDKDWLLVPGIKLIQISAVNNTEVWGVESGTRAVYRYDGTTWAKISDTPHNYIFVPSGTLKTTIPGKTETKTVEGGSVVAGDGAPQGVADTARVAIEIEKLGMGGGLAPQTTSDYVAIPVKKKPKVAGFAETSFDGFTKGDTLNLTPLLSKGIAWLETSVNAGRTTVSFMALAKDAGGVEVVFGQDISTNFIWKVRIGGWNNAKSGIIKRTIVDNIPKDTLVAQTLPKEDPTNTLIPSNPLARVLPGQMVAYWITIDNGLILVGSGNPGENVFMSWRDPNPPDGVNRVGVASDTKPVEYANLQLQAPIVLDTAPQPYATISDIIQPTSNITWSKYPFRVNDRGMLSFDVKGDNKVVVALGQDEKPADGNYYQIVFGYGNNEGIMIQKWIADDKKLKTIASVSADTYQAIKLNSSSSIPFWISYEYGQIMVGQGAPGRNLILCTKDIAAFDGIRSIGFASLDGKPASISGLKLYPPTSLTLEKASQAYKTPTQQAAFAGNMTIIFPFEYQFSQLDQSVKMEDLVNHLSFYVGATPQQGTLYNFMLTIDKAGTPMLDLTVAPDTEALKAVQLSLLQGQKDIALKKAEADAQSKAGALKKMAADAQGQLDRTKSQAQIQTGQFIQQAGAGIASAGAFGMGVMGEGIGVNIARGTGIATLVAGVGMSAGSINNAVIGQNMLEDAGKKELAGAEAQIAAEKQAMATAAEADKATIQQQLVEGQASFSFRGADSYVFLDKTDRKALGSLTVKPEAQASADMVQSLLANLRQPTADEFAAYVSMLHKIILNINYFKVVEAKSTREMIYSYIQTMYLAYTKQFFPDPTSRPAAINSEIVNILIGAYNNTFLINEADSNEAVTKKTWNTWINEIGRDSITQQNFDFNLEPMFGEYIWHPQPIINNKVTVMFQAKANNDIFISFSPVNHAVRNTSTEIYEVVLGGWDDTKSVIRIKSLDHSAKEVSTEDLLNTLDYKDYWISYDKGLINVGTGDNPNDKTSIFITWQDPYPNKTNPMKYIGFSCWNSPITLKNIRISDASGKLPTVPAVQSSTQPEAAQAVPQDQQQLTPTDQTTAEQQIDQTQLSQDDINKMIDDLLKNSETTTADATVSTAAATEPTDSAPIIDTVPQESVATVKKAPKILPKKVTTTKKNSNKNKQAQITKKRPIPAKSDDSTTY